MFWLKMIGFDQYHAIDIARWSVNVCTLIYGDAFLTSALDGVQWSAKRPGRLFSRKIAPSTDWIGFVGPRIVLDVLEDTRMCLRWEFLRSSSVIQPGGNSLCIIFNMTQLVQERAVCIPSTRCSCCLWVTSTRLFDGLELKHKNWNVIVTQW